MTGPGDQSGVVPGWYPDPCGDYTLRWWDGARWSDEVTTGRFRGLSPLPSPGEPLLPAQEEVLWQHGRDVLTTHRLFISPAASTGPPTEFALWMVAGAEARGSIGDHADIGITIAFPGYGGRATWVLRGVGGAAQVAATVLRQANRVRRSAGG